MRLIVCIKSKPLDIIAVMRQWDETGRAWRKVRTSYCFEIEFDRVIQHEFASTDWDGFARNELNIEGCGRIDGVDHSVWRYSPLFCSYLSEIAIN